jgi:hypothetical protein
MRWFQITTTATMMMLITGASGMSIPHNVDFLHSSNLLQKRANATVNPLPAIIGGTIGGLALIGLVAVVMYLLMRRKEDRKRNDPELQLDGFAALERAEEERKAGEKAKMAAGKEGILLKLFGRKGGNGSRDIEITETELESITPPPINDTPRTPVEMNADPEDVGARPRAYSSPRSEHSRGNRVSVIPEEVPSGGFDRRPSQGLVIMTNDDTVEQMLVSARASRVVSEGMTSPPMPGFSPVSPIVAEEQRIK